MVNLSNHVCCFAFVLSKACCFVVGGVSEICGFRHDDIVAIGFPQSPRFRTSLEGSKCQWRFSSVQGFVMFLLHHSAHASSILAQVSMSDPGE